ncbi:MAG: hypothetical protein ACLFPU_09060 [Dehalococcoidia bacterium]
MVRVWICGQVGRKLTKAYVQAKILLKLNKGTLMRIGKMTGRIKAGKGSLIGDAGEYYVMAELLKQGIIAALAPVVK